jgi:3-oxoacyl-[acyl-carrier-protein] synthase-3
VRYNRVALEALGYELAPVVVTSAAIEDRLAPLYEKLRIQPGQLEALSGIRERRLWEPGTKMSDGALKAARVALERSGISPSDVGAVVYGGVCRDNLEPATACAVAEGLGIRGAAIVQDVSNACLGVLSGMLLVANAIELGQIQAGIVCSCESAREILDIAIEGMIAAGSMDAFRTSLATLTGGSGAVAVVLAHEDLSVAGHRLLGGVVRSAPEHHRICRWGPDTGIPPSGPMVAETDAHAVLTHGVALARETWPEFQKEMSWSAAELDRVFFHQVTKGHERAILEAFEISPAKDFTTVEFLGNTGTVALPITLALGVERGLVSPGDRVGLFGIGSGLNIVMMGVSW